MKIVGIEGLDGRQLATALDRGAKFVLYQYCISLVVVTLKRPSDVYFIPAGHSTVANRLGLSLISLVCGWWGIPWGPVHTVGTVVTHLSGGKVVTREVVASLRQSV